MDFESLKLFEKINLNLNDKNNDKQFDVVSLSSSYDHIIRIHNFSDIKEEIQYYVQKQIGASCKYGKKCLSLFGHINRKREVSDNNLIINQIFH